MPAKPDVPLTVTESDTVVRGLGVAWFAVLVTCCDESNTKVSAATPGNVVATAWVSPLVDAARLSVYE